MFGATGRAHDFCKINIFDPRTTVESAPRRSDDILRRDIYFHIHGAIIFSSAGAAKSRFFPPKPNDCVATPLT